MTPTILMTLTFVVSAFIAFFTGTSWGTYAIVTPICVQMALNISGGAHIDHVTAFFNFLLFFSPKCIIFGKSMIFCIKSIVFDKFFIMSYLK